MNRRVVCLSTFILSLALASWGVPLGTAFTYQGSFSDSGSPAEGVFDFRFILYDASPGGSQVGPIVYVHDLTVQAGRVSTEIDFGDVFDGGERWLEIAVREGASSGTYDTLSPRQELTATPHALYARSADDADLLGGQVPNFYRSWSTLLGVPAGLADGDDDTLGDLTCATDQIARWTGTNWACSDEVGTAYARTFVVGPVGTNRDNGEALRDAIASLPYPGSQAESLLLRIEPGVYDVGDLQLFLRPWLAVVGAGEAQTRITSSICFGGINKGTIRNTEDNVEIRHLMISNSCADDTLYSVALDQEGSFVKIKHVSFWVSGAAKRNVGLFNAGSNVDVMHAAFNISNGTTDNRAIVSSGDHLSLESVSMKASHGDTFTTGLLNSGDYLRLERVYAATSAGTGECTGIWNNEGDFFDLIDVETGGGCSGSTDSGFYSKNASGELIDVRAVGDRAIEIANDSDTHVVTLTRVEAAVADYGLYANETGGTLIVEADHSAFAGSVNSVLNVASKATVRIGGSRLDEVVGGDVTCVAVYEGDYLTFLPDTCPTSP